MVHGAGDGKAAFTASMHAAEPRLAGVQIRPSAAHAASRRLPLRSAAPKSGPTAKRDEAPSLFACLCGRLNHARATGGGAFSLPDELF